MRFIQLSVFAAVIVAAFWAVLVWRIPTALADAPHAGAATQPSAVVAPDEAMRRLREGNDRFVQQTATNGHRDATRREELARGQHPFAVVLGCADSRVPPEVIGSIEYAV